MANTAAAENPVVDSGADRLVVDTTTQAFMKDVVEESRTRPVLVDFWAPWCGPCRTLSPIIENAVRAAGGKVRLAKMNIDDHPAIPGQMGIQSIPAVIAFVDGKPVDGFLGAIPESQVKAFIDKVTSDAEGGLEAPDVEAILAEAEAGLTAGDLAYAGELYNEALAVAPDDIRAVTGLARIAVVAGNLDQANEILASVPEAKANDAGVVAVRAELALAERTAGLGDRRQLEARIKADPADHQAKLDLALIENASGNRIAAIDRLLEIFRADRAWNDQAARKQLVQFFEAWGPTDEATLSGRRRLSSLLFS